MPLTDTRGMNTAQVVRMELSIGAITSEVPSVTALRSSSPLCHLAVKEHYHVVCKHAHTEQKSREGDYIQRHSRHAEHEHGTDEGQWHREGDQPRRPEILHEQENYQAGENNTHNDILDEVPDRIIQQLGLISGDPEFHLRIVGFEQPELGRKRFAQL